MLSGQCAINNIVPLVIEAGGGGIIDDAIDQGVECTLNILKHLNMIDGDPVLPPRQIMVKNYVVYRSLSGGFYIQEPGVKLGLEVKQGQVLLPVWSIRSPAKCARPVPRRSTASSSVAACVCRSIPAATSPTSPTPIRSSGSVRTAEVVMGDNLTLSQSRSRGDNQLVLHLFCTAT